MSCIVPRTCTEGKEGEHGQDREVRSRPLAAFREASAYVLLGDPGSGKSTSFTAESAALGGAAYLESARDFLTLDRDSERRGKTLFIDGLDEVRVWGSDARTPLDELRRRIDALGRPRFRLSCREADWLGTNDRGNLAKVSSDADLTVLRLDPLSDQNIAQILDARSRLDTRSFIETAREKGVGGFLENPQCLNMLADVVMGSGGWPEIRLELFEQACLQMLHEHNPEHVAATERSSSSTAIPEEVVLRAAGRLCAVLLISGSSGCAVGPSREDAEYPELSRCAGEHRAAARQAISTKLFKAAAEGRYEPVHRHVAEFLAGRYLARLVEGERRNGRRGRPGVPARRIVALMTGHDGGVVTELRGLSAWIAAQGQTARNEFIERDPIGVGLYGDIGEFSVREKHDLLDALERASSRLHLASGATAAFGSLATSAMQPVIEEILRDACREPAHRSLIKFMLSVLLHGAMLPGLAGDLLSLVYNDTSSSHVKELALRAFLRHSTDGDEKTNTLKSLLADVHAGVISDPDEELRGLLLGVLFPQDVAPSEVWDYLTAQDPELIGLCWGFWACQIPDESSDEEVIELLDGLGRRFSDLRPALATRWEGQRTPMRLLARALDLRGGTTDTKRLYDWLGVGLVSPRQDSAATDEASRIRSWLEGHPEIQKAVFAEGVDRCAESGGPRIDASDVWDRLYGSTLPADFGLWCLNQAVRATDERIGRYFLERAFGAMIERSGDDGLSLEVLIEGASAHPILSSIFSDLGVCHLDDGYARRRERKVNKEHREDERLGRHQRWVDYVRSHGDALRSNRGAPQLLHQIAAAYFGALPEAEGADPVARLGSVFLHDGQLITTALDALRGAIRRDDLPDPSEIIRLRDQNREHSLALPVRAGLAESERVASDELVGLDDGRLRIALAFHYSDVSGEESTWYRRLLASHTQLVAEVLVLSAKAEIRNRRSHISGLSELAYSDDHADVARIASLALLRTFPIRCASRQMGGMRYLLWSALQHGDLDSFRSLIEQKLSRKSMDAGQRASWLMAGVIVSPETWLRALNEFAEGRERRVGHIAEFLNYHPRLSFPIDRLETQALRLLIRLVGRVYAPSASGIVTPAMEVSDRVGWLIQRLAESPTEETGAALEALAAETKLSRWRPYILRARDDQRVVRRDAAYRHPEVEQICRTLDGAAPANAADLAALVTDRLVELGDRIPNGNTDDWRQYWNEDSHGRPCKPKHEESCRDALLSDLRQCLPEEVDAQPEGQYADDKRADIRISCRDFQVPVEIKKNSHPKLWSAMRDQLMAQYTSDPATDGYGIYLVLWFGDVDGHRTPPPPSGVRPDSPEALKARLEEALTPEEARKISVCVIEVSAPSAKPR